MSECGRYKVCCVTLNGVDVFEAWHKGKMLDAATSETSAAMRKVCAEHAASSAAPEVDFTPFGRALLQTGARPLSEEPDGYMLYWLALPIYQHQYVIWRDKATMCRAILAWHGRDGFRVIWRPVEEWL